MLKPYACVIWVNYNSMKFIELALESLESIVAEDDGRLEVIVVDNGSRDGSMDAIEEFARRSSTPFRVIRLNENRGFAEAADVGFETAVKDGCRYVILVNNDAVVEPGAFAEMLEYMEVYRSVGAVNGILLNPRTGRIDSAGGVLLDNGLLAVRWFEAEPGAPAKHPVYVSYADGALCAYRVEAVRRAGYKGLPFIPETFGYCDDNLLSFAMWSVGYRVVALPKVLGRHARSSTFGSRPGFKQYLGLRCLSMHAHGFMPRRVRLLLGAVLAKRAIVAAARFRSVSLLRLYAGAWKDGARLARRYKWYLSTVDWRAIPKYRMSWLRKLLALVKYTVAGVDWRRYDDEHRAPP